jgi:hypothetical protein
MASKDLHYTITPVQALNIGVIGSSTTTYGNIIDMQEYEAIEFTVQAGSITDGTYVSLLQDGNDSGLSDVATVDTAFVLGAISFDNSMDNTVQSIGYVGKKRYVRLALVSSGVTTGGTFGITALKGFARHNPTSGSNTATG